MSFADFRLVPRRRSGGFTLVELLVVIANALVLWSDQPSASSQAS